MTLKRVIVVMSCIMLVASVIPAIAQDGSSEPVVYEGIDFPDLPYASRWIEVNGTQIHYMETGDPSADPILLLHGIPAWSYIWRDVMPHLENSGRVIAVDFPGYGRSGKLDAYSLEVFADYLAGFVSAMELENITLVVQDLGSAAGLSFAAHHSELVSRVVLMEAALPPIFPINLDDLANAGAAGELWQLMITDGMAQEMFLNQNFFIEGVLSQLVLEPFTEEEMNAYRAPVPHPEDRLAFLQGSPGQILYGVTKEEVEQFFSDYITWLTQSDLPMLMLYVEPGILGTADSVAWAQSNIQNLETVFLGDGLHFFQEDQPDAVGAAIAEWLEE